MKFFLTESRLHRRQCSEMCSKLFLPWQCSPDIATVFEDKEHEAVKYARFEYLTKILIKLAVLAGYMPVNSHGKCMQIPLFTLKSPLFLFHETEGEVVSLFKPLTFGFMSMPPIFLCGEDSHLKSCHC